MTTPAYGKWTEEQLRELVRAEIRREAPRSDGERAGMAMHLSRDTGASYRWLWDEIERRCA